MSSLNKRESNLTERNHGGLAVRAISPEAQLMRLTLANMLWEDQFYIDGKSNEQLLQEVVTKVSPAKAIEIAKLARSKFKLRHVPLAIARGLARAGTLQANDLTEIIQRPDEMSEFLAMYWKDGKSPISNQVKKGLASAMLKFNEYQLAKWDKNSAKISLRDVMFLTHPKPKTPEQENLFLRLANNELKTPDTWETQLSAGANKKETFTRLMTERKLGALAFLRNLRNMLEAGVSEALISEYSTTVPLERVLPFRFIAAANVVPAFSKMLENMMFRCLKEHSKLGGRTVLLVDVSWSMFGAKVSDKSDLVRFDAAAALAILCKEICEKVEVYTFSNRLARVDDRKNGFALRSAMYASQDHSGTDLARAIHELNRLTLKGNDRLIVFTDEQSQTSPGKVLSDNNYIINVASYQNGINQDHKFTTISGFSEAVLDYIIEAEASRF